MAFRSDGRIRTEFRTVETEFFRTVSTLVVSAFSLVAALAWNTAITMLIQRYLKTGSGVISWLVYAVAVTLVAVFVTIYLGRLAKHYDQHDAIKE